MGFESVFQQVAAVLVVCVGASVEVLVVDFDPRSVRDRERMRASDDDHAGPPVVFGDAEDPHLPEMLPLQRTRWVISTVRSTDVSLHVVQAFRHAGYTGNIAVAVDDADAEPQLLEAGADVAIRPLHVAAGPLLELLEAHGDHDEDLPTG